MASQPTVVVTGATGAIGSAVASAFAAGGYAVVGIDRRPGNAVVLEIDLRNPIPVELELISRHVADKSCAGLIVCHGTLLSGDSPMSDIHIGTSIDDNLISFMRLVKLLFAAASERSREYRLVTVSSLASRTGSNDLAYAAAKAAVTAATLSLARQRLNGIVACVVELGPVSSPMNTSKASRAEYYLSRSPIGRLITPDEVGGLVWSIWPHVHCLNGSVIPVDGGIRIS